MSFISYAQNFEDVMLWRALGHIDRGFYIDVGANVPDGESVTKAFYDRGWNGINVEPYAEIFAVLASAREHDINLNLGCWREAGDHTLYLIDDVSTLATLEPAMAKYHANAGHTIRETRIATTTLADICAEHVGSRDIHFLKIDVEGGEASVVAGADFTRWRPWIVITESHGPDLSINTYQPCEDILLAGHYRFCYCDGLNRFYIAEERWGGLCKHFRTPPNVYDNFVRATEIAWRERAEFAEAELAKIVASTTWRATAPLRSIVQAVKTLGRAGGVEER